MAVEAKGKQIAGKSPAGRSSSAAKSSGVDKRKKPVDGTAKPSSSRRKRRRRSGVLQFFDDAAEEVSADEDDFYSSDFEAEKPNPEANFGHYSQHSKDAGGSGSQNHIPVFIKEEELSGDELERLIADRYGNEYDEDTKGFDSDMHMKDPTIWKIKCTPGCERKITLSLMQKYAHLKDLGTVLHIFSVFALDNVQGYVFAEADKSSDISEACKGFCNLYSSRMWPVPRNEVPHLLSARNKPCEVSNGQWVRLKNGQYKGDIAQVVSVDALRKRATVKVVPRVDFQALARKFGGGESLKQTEVPNPRLISSRDLEVFRPYIESRRDRETGEIYEVLDGLMLKDGFLYKRVAFGSLIFWDVKPSDDEKQMFTDPNKDDDWESDWLSSVYVGGSSSTSGKSAKHTAEAGEGSGFNLHDLVLFGRKAFGVIVSIESDSFQILKGDKNASEVVIVRLQEIKKACIDKMFTSSDLHKKKICIGDEVRVLEGPLQGRKGVVKHMYKGILFVYDETQEDAGGIFCVRSDLCENTTESISSYGKKSGKQASSSSIQSPNFTFEEEDTNRGFDRSRKSNTHSIFSIGQTLRINKGPLKGYLCRVMRIFRSEITVKLDSLAKVITVEEQLLSVPNLKRDEPAAAASDAFGSEDWGSFGLFSGEKKDVPDDKSSWDVELPSSGRDSWQGLASDIQSAGKLDSQTDKKQDDDPWGNKMGGTSGTHDQTNQASDSWGAAAGSSADASWKKAGAGDKTTDNWEAGSGGWKTASDKAETDGWEKAKLPSADAGSSWENESSKHFGLGQNSSQNGSSATGATFSKTDADGWGAWGNGSSKGPGINNSSDAMANCKTPRSNSEHDSVNDPNMTDTGDNAGKGKACTDGLSDKWDKSKDATNYEGGSWKNSVSNDSWDVPKTSRTDSESIWCKGKNSNVGPSENRSEVRDICAGESGGWDKAGSSSQAPKVEWSKWKTSTGDESSNRDKDKVSGGGDGGSWSVAKDAGGEADGGGWGKSGFSNKAQIDDGWGQQSRSKQEVDEPDNWNSAKSFSDTKPDAWGKKPTFNSDKPVSGWNRFGNEENANEQRDNWNRRNEGGRGFGSGGGKGRSGGGRDFDWSKRRNNSDEADGDGGASFGEGRGRGRGWGSGRGRGRDSYGAGEWKDRSSDGKSFDHSRDQGRGHRRDSSEWNNHANNFEGDSNNPHLWGSEQPASSDIPKDKQWGGWGGDCPGKDLSSGWKSSDRDDHSSSWGKGHNTVNPSSAWGTDQGKENRGNKSSSWDEDMEDKSEADAAGGWGSVKLPGNKDSSGWGDETFGRKDEQEVAGKSWDNATPNWNDDSSSKRGKPGGGSSWNNDEGGWNKPKFSSDGPASNWNSNEGSGREGGRGGWSRGKTFGEDQSSGYEGNTFSRGRGRGRGYGGGGRGDREGGRDFGGQGGKGGDREGGWGFGGRGGRGGDRGGRGFGGRGGRGGRGFGGRGIEKEDDSSDRYGAPSWGGQGGGWGGGSSASKNSWGGWNSQDSGDKRGEDRAKDEVGGSSGWAGGSGGGWQDTSNGDKQASGWGNSAKEGNAGNEQAGKAWEGAGSPAKDNKGDWNKGGW